MPDPYDLAVRLETDAKDMMVAGEYKPLIDYGTLGPEALLSIPTPDHYLPMLYVLVTRQEREAIISNRRRRWRIDIHADYAGGLGLSPAGEMEKRATKAALLGATDFVGSALLREALDRGHIVTAIRTRSSSAGSRHHASVPVAPSRWLSAHICANELPLAVGNLYKRMLSTLLAGSSESLKIPAFRFRPSQVRAYCDSAGG